MSKTRTHSFGYRQVTAEDKTALVGDVFDSVAPHYDWCLTTSIAPVFSVGITSTSWEKSKMPTGNNTCSDLPMLAMFEPPGLGHETLWQSH